MAYKCGATGVEHDPENKFVISIELLEKYT